MKEIIFKEINPLTIAVFRIVFGFFAFLEIIYFYKTYLIEDYIIQPKVLFNYSFLPVSPFSENMLQLMLGITLISTIFILIGKYYKVSIITFFIGFTYFFLLDKSYYNNHLYLFSLVSFIMIFIPADNLLSYGKKKKYKPTFTWHLRILQFQFIVVYFFGGLAKLNGDWLTFYEPLTTTLQINGIYSEGLAFFLTYTGLLFDLFIGLFLLLKRTRLYATITAILFNVINHFLFDDINIFPFFMMASLVLFYHLNEISIFSKLNSIEAIKDKSCSSNLLVLIGLSIYVLVQISLPLRHYFIPGNVDWTGEGGRFSWRMKIQTRSIEQCEFAIFDLNTKTIYPVQINNHIHDVQKFQMIHYPKMILDFSHYLKDFAKNEYNMKNVMVKAKIRVKFNHRSDVEVVSNKLDLSKERWNYFAHNKWINPL